MQPRWIALFVVVAGFGAAPQAHAECRPPPADARLKLGFKPDTRLEEIARWIAAATCKPVIYGAGVDPTTRLTIIGQGEIAASAAYALFVDALAAVDLRATQGQQSIIVKPTAACAAGACAPCAERRVASAAAAPELSARELERGIRRRSPTLHVVQRSVLDAALGDSRLFMRSARLVPAIRDGKPDGFRLFGIRPGSFFDRLGLRNGDTVHEMNGLPMTSPEQTLLAYTKLRAATQIAVRITRQGGPLTLQYRISP